MLVNLLNNLIEKKYYSEKLGIQNKLDVFYAMSKISDEDYTSLTLKVEELYKVEATETTEVTGPSTEENVESEG